MPAFYEIEKTSDIGAQISAMEKFFKCKIEPLQKAMQEIGPVKVMMDIDKRGVEAIRDLYKIASKYSPHLLNSPNL